MSTTITKTVVAGIPAAFTVAAPSSSAKCTWAVTGQPGSVTAGTGGTNNCTVLIDGVWPKQAADTITAKVTAGGKSTVFTIKVNVLGSPCENDATAVGSDTITPLTDQLSTDYNNSLGGHPSSCSKVSTSKPFEESWDAVNPITGKIGDTIAEKADCPSIMRPDGSSAGIGQLATFKTSTSGPYCTNFARSSRPRASTDPPFAAGGVAFVALAGDAVTWSHQATSDAPKSLTVQQLNAIYTCTDTNWSQVGGKNAPIQPFLPQPGSGTLAFFEAAIGVTSPGPCVSNDSNLLEENEGVNKVLQSPEAIFPFSIGDYIAQSQHSAKCLNTNVKAGTACSPNTHGVVCVHVPSKNFFYCDEHGTMALGQIGGVAPITGSGAKEKINPNFPIAFDRTLYNVVPFNTASSPIPSGSKPVGGLVLTGLFGNKGYDCTNSKAKTDIKSYGFIPLKTCGTAN